MILAFDTYYVNTKAKTVAIVFQNWESETIENKYEETIENVEEYESGAFYKRELPCILSLIKKIPIENIEVIIVDGYVYLDDSFRLGLGGYLYEALKKNIPIVGVAKNNFATLEKNKQIVYRAGSKRPLYITSVGLDIVKVSEKIKSMYGDYRIPYLLKKLDTLTKD